MKEGGREGECEEEGNVSVRERGREGGSESVRKGGREGGRMSEREGACMVLSTTSAPSYAQAGPDRNGQSTPEAVRDGKAG